MNPVAFGLLCTLPLAAWFAHRQIWFRTRLDAQARRRLLARAAVFLVLTTAVTSLLYANTGRYPLSLARLLLLVIATAVLLLGFLKRT